MNYLNGQKVSGPSAGILKSSAYVASMKDAMDDAGLTEMSLSLGFGIAAARNKTAIVKPKNSFIRVKLKFKSSETLNEHYGKHHKEIMDALDLKEYSINDYVNDANHVINTGKYVPVLNGYVKLVGGKGKAKFAFVGLDRLTGEITTFHLKTVKQLIKKAPSLNLEK
ncbi:hypothetical protein HCJ21_09945 [Listeria seeligeri]|nr:hypothetical protein [Listeria seeligeri]MBC1596688.1 hypothetical protein [Listeria seeligeri]MBC1599579.1 hypothetical protein [Listeria seeligeri]MBC2044488.1 hypothetical protein [Listeria seeligeri]MBC2051382.1 hypothetical protein [Listeria seeligeri]